MEYQEEVFKECPMCGGSWKNREGFLQDGSLQINGYQADFESLESGLLFFTHHVEGCHSTMALQVREFIDLNPGVRHCERKTLTKECPQYCFYESELGRCEVACECAFVRDLIDILRQRKFNFVQVE